LPSNAFSTHLVQLLSDAEELEDTHAEMRTGSPGRQYGLASLNRAAVIMCVSAWEAYIEELVRESLEILRPASPPLGLWPALNASVRSQLGRFNTPNADQVRLLISDALGLPDVHLSWTWRNCNSSQAVQRLTVAMDLRHRIAHGVNPRPIVHHLYSSQLPDFFRRLARCTDAAVRHHLVTVLGIANPWTS
jgi:RiboL-PSP-HEPN